MTERSGNYYGYSVYSSSEEIIVDIYSSDVKEYLFSISSKENSLYFRAAYNKFIIL